MLYSRSSGRWKETVRHGLGSGRTFLVRKSDQSSMLTSIHLDVLNRFPDSKSSTQTVHVMKYIFPRQFGLQNVFALADRNGNTDQFNAHASREKEIFERRGRRKQKHVHSMHNPGSASEKLPKRLRGQAMDLVRALRVRHVRCSYSELLKYYCPPEVSSLSPVAAYYPLTPTVDWTMETRPGYFSRQKADRSQWAWVPDG